MMKKFSAVTGFGIGCFIKTSDGSEVTTGTPTCKRILDGTAGTCANAASYDSTAGVWKINLDAADTNADTIVLVFKLTDCQPITYTISTVLEYQQVDVMAIKGTPIGTEAGAGQIAAAFKKFFDVATPTGTVNQIPDSKPIVDGSGNTRAVDSSGNALAPAATALHNATWSDTKAGYLDAAISGRASPTNVTDAVTAIEAHGDLNWLTAVSTAANNLPVDGDYLSTAQKASLTAAGSGSWYSAPSGWATPSDVSGLATTLANAHGAGSWATATGFATTDASTFTNAFSAGVLANAPTGATAPPINILPLAVTVGAGVVASYDLTAYKDAIGQWVLSVTDEQGDPVTLTGKTLWMTFSKYGALNTAVWTLTTAGPSGDKLTIGGTDGNQVTVDLDDAHTSTKTIYYWRMADVTDVHDVVVLCEGTLTVA